MRQYTYLVYILTNKTNTTLYIGVTNNIYRRIWEHLDRGCEGFSKRYRLTKLVYVEETSSIIEAILREKQLKNWRRSWKLELIKSVNPTFQDLAAGWFSGTDSGSSPE